MLDGVLFFPVTPFTPSGDVDYTLLAEHLDKGVAAGPGGVFVACGTGEFHALGLDEFSKIVATAVEVVAERVPVFAGAGGSLVQAKEFARSAEAAGADGILLLPPYLVTMPHGKGQTVYLGSGETWRLRAYREGFHERFWTGLARHAAAGSLSSRPRDDKKP